MSARASKALVALAITALVGAFTVTVASAGPQPDPFLAVDPVSEEVEQPTFDFEVIGQPCLDDTTVEVEGVPDAQITLDSPNSGTIVLPEGTPGGGLEVTLTCTTDAGTQTFTGFIEFGNVIVEKVVGGDAPADASFVVDVTCEGGIESSPEYGASPEGFDPGSLQGQVTFGPGGGTDFLVHYSGQECTITEPEDGGASETTIETSDCEGEEVPLGTEADAGVSGDFFIDAPVDCTQTVTNVFAAAAAPAAQPAAVTPTFTG